MKMKKLKIRYIRIDSWNRPVFRAIDKQMYFGSVNFLFRNEDEPQKIEEFFEKNIDNLVYFGSHYNCEPLGLHPSELKEPVQLEIVRGSKYE